MNADKTKSRSAGQKRQWAPRAGSIYQLKIALLYIVPTIWRRVGVPGGFTFDDLHDTIQIAMGWENCHLWAFYVGKTEIGPESDQLDFPGVPSARPSDSTTLDGMLAGRRIKFRYVYDMGDSWLHEIKVEKLLLPEAGLRYPRCTGGARACPPEDCGGFGGYQNLVAAISKPRHPDHEEMLEWVGEEWDPEAFDMDAVNAWLQPRRRKSAGSLKK